MGDQRIERAVGMIGRTAERDPGAAFPFEPRAQGVHQPGFADARLAADQDYLSDARPALLPGAPQQSQLMLAPDQLGERAPVRRLEPALRRALADHMPGRDRLRKALEFLNPKVCEIEGLADQEPSNLFFLRIRNKTKKFRKFKADS